MNSTCQSTDDETRWPTSRSCSCSPAPSPSPAPYSRPPSAAGSSSWQLPSASTSSCSSPPAPARRRCSSAWSEPGAPDTPRWPADNILHSPTPPERNRHVPISDLQDLRPGELGRLRPARRTGDGRRPESSALPGPPDSSPHPPGAAGSHLRAAVKVHLVRREGPGLSPGGRAEPPETHAAQRHCQTEHCPHR